VELSAQYQIQKGDWVSKIAKETLRLEGDTNITKAEIFQRTKEIADFNHLRCADCIKAGGWLDLSPWLCSDTPQPVAPQKPVQTEPIPEEVTEEKQLDRHVNGILPAWDLPEKDRTIIIISGHGGQRDGHKCHDPGAFSVDGNHVERDYCEMVTKLQVAELRAKGYNVIEVETTNVEGKPSLDEHRALKAQYPNVPIIHNHFNSATATASGSDTYYGTAGGFGLAQSIQGNLNAVSAKYGFKSDRQTHNKQYRVLKPIDMDNDGDIDKNDLALDCSVLVEYDFITNKKVVYQLNRGFERSDSPNYLTEKAYAAAAGVTQFLHQRNSKFSH